jgi:hypothetical protein
LRRFVQSERHIFFIILFFPRFDNKETIFFHSCFIYTHNPLKGIVGAVVIFDHGRKFGIFSIAPDHPAPQKSFAIKKNTKLFLDIFF